METSIKINNNKEYLKLNAYATIVYKNNFNTDMIEDNLLLIQQLENFIKLRDEYKITNSIDMYNLYLENVDELLIYQLIWTYMKMYNKHTIPFIEWLKKLTTSSMDIVLQDNFNNILIGNLLKKDMRTSDNNSNFNLLNTMGTENSIKEGIFKTENLLHLINITKLPNYLLKEYTVGNCLDYIDSYIEYEKDIINTKDEPQLIPANEEFFNNF